MATDEKAPTSTAVWYFVAATFLFLASGTAIRDWSPILGWVGFAVGVIVIVVGIVVYGRERAARRT